MDIVIVFGISCKLSKAQFATECARLLGELGGRMGRRILLERVYCVERWPGITPQKQAQEWCGYLDLVGAGPRGDGAPDA